MLAAAAGARVDLSQDLLRIGAPLVGQDPADLFPADRGDVVAQRGEPLLQVLGLVGVEAGELDRREHLAGLHRGPAHDRELVDERVDRRDDAVAAAALTVVVGAAIEAVARPARGPAGGDAAEHRGAGHAALGRALAARLV